MCLCVCVRILLQDDLNGAQLALPVQKKLQQVDSFAHSVPVCLSLLADVVKVWREGYNIYETFLLTLIHKCPGNSPQLA